MHHVGCVDRRFALDHATGLVDLRVRLGVALDQVDVRDDHLVTEHAHNVALLALVLAGGDDHAVTLLDTVHVCFLRSEHFGCERDDLHELLGTQFAGHGPEDARADRLVLVVEQHRGVAVEADQRTVGAAHAFAGAHHDGVVDLALLDLAARDRVLHRHLDDVADAGVAALGAAEHLDAHHFPGAGVVCHVEVALHLDHGSASSYSAARETISATRQFLVFDIGAISTTRTTSPSLQLLSASWAWSLLERRMYLPYSACLSCRSTRTVTDFSILLLTTQPSTVRCRPFSGVFSMLFMVTSLTSASRATSSRVRSRGGRGARRGSWPAGRWP